MNKNFKVIQINGLSGILLLGFIIAGIICGFALFPIWVIMIGWNELSTSFFNGPVINYNQAFLLWLFIVLCSYLFLRNSVTIKFQKTNESDPEEIEKIVEDNIKNLEENENEK